MHSFEALFSRVCFTLLWLASSCVMAQPSKPMSFSVFTPCRGTASFCAPRILADGVIEQATAAKFLAFWKQNSYGTVCFNSPGGSLSGGVELGRQLRRLRLSSCLQSEYVEEVKEGLRTITPRGQCASACAMAFLGGSARSVEGENVFGVHQFSGVKGNIGDGSTQITVVFLASYLEEMGIDRRLLDLASLIPAHTIRWLNHRELVDLRVDNTTVLVTKWEIIPLQDGSIIAAMRQQLDGMRGETILVLWKNGSQPLLLVRYTPQLMTPEAASEAVKLLREASQRDSGGCNQVGLIFDNSIKFNWCDISWRQSGKSAEATLQLSDDVVERLRKGGFVEFFVNLPNAYRHFDPSVRASLSDSRGPIAAALK